MAKHPQKPKRIAPGTARPKSGTRRERARKRARLGRFSTISGYVAALLLPGGVALLPVLAWWHRHQRLEREAAKKNARRKARRISQGGQRET